jgi:hypothetical protein
VLEVLGLDSNGRDWGKWGWGGITHTVAGRQMAYISILCCGVLSIALKTQSLFVFL